MAGPRPRPAAQGQAVSHACHQRKALSLSLQYQQQLDLFPATGLPSPGRMVAPPGLAGSGWLAILHNKEINSPQQCTLEHRTGVLECLNGLECTQTRDASVGLWCMGRSSADDSDSEMFICCWVSELVRCTTLARMHTPWHAASCSACPRGAYAYALLRAISDPGQRPRNNATTCLQEHIDRAIAGPRLLPTLLGLWHRPLTCS